MRGVPTDIGIVHFVGIGGIGMSGIAEVMHNLGYQVQGSDIADSYVIDGLRERGIKVTIGHSAENLGAAAVVVTSTAVKAGNPERDAALERRIPLAVSLLIRSFAHFTQTQRRIFCIILKN
jgi:UDP-N-acetylmuramate--alanine ligase